MGLCKCPKKKVTNLFCFEHRVNVCEYCLEESHSKCIVQSYLSWLTDSDYDVNCCFCRTPLVEKDTVRLQCFHLFHWDCVNAWAAGFPANTAPAGYRCPLCKEAIFPSTNQTSPTIDRLRATLQQANWARAGLGLPLLPELENGQRSRSVTEQSSDHFVPPSSIVEPGVYYSSDATSHGVRSGTPATILNVEETFAQSSDRHHHFTARKSNPTEDDRYNSSMKLLDQRDEDLPENKYKRRSAGEWFSRWMRSRYDGRRTSDPFKGYKRFCFVLIIIVIILLTLFSILPRIISGPGDEDPAFDPLANPHVRVAAVHDSPVDPYE